MATPPAVALPLLGNMKCYISVTPMLSFMFMLLVYSPPWTTKCGVSHPVFTYIVYTVESTTLWIPTSYAYLKCVMTNVANAFMSGHTDEEFPYVC